MKKNGGGADKSKQLPRRQSVLAASKQSSTTNSRTSSASSKRSLQRRQSSVITEGSNSSSGVGSKQLTRGKSKSTLLKTLLGNTDSSSLVKDLFSERIEEETPSNSKFFRRTRAEDPHFNAPAVPRLVELGLNRIVEIFHEHTDVLEKLPEKFKVRVLSQLPTDLSLTVIARVIKDEGYWKRKCQSRWNICDLSEHGGLWKQLYMEKTMQEAIECFIPGSSDIAELNNLLELSADFINKLEITQLHPKSLKTDQPTVSTETKQQQNNNSSNHQYPDRFDPIFQHASKLQAPQSPEGHDEELDHFDFTSLLPMLPRLKELYIQCAVKNCGVEFQWNLFRLSSQDVFALARSVSLCPNLKHLTITNSRLDDAGIKTMCTQLKTHKHLKSLNLSHNIIGDGGAKLLASTLLSGTVAKLESLDLSDNAIKEVGGRALAHALLTNRSLTALSLRMNGMGDTVGAELLSALEKNISLEILDLAGNNLAVATIEALCKLLKLNLQLKEMDLSCNAFGKEHDAMLEEAMKENKTLRKLDLRTSVGREIEYIISELCERNLDAVENAHNKYF